MCSGTSSPTSVTHFIDLDRPSEEVFSRDLSDFPSLENGTGTNDEDELSLGLPTELKRKKQQLDAGGQTLRAIGDSTMFIEFT